MNQPLRSKSNLLSLRRRLVSLRQQALDLRLRHVLECRYDPNQPRVPAGSPNGGRWTSDGGGGSNGAYRNREVAPQAERLKVDDRAGRITLAARRKIDECALQYERDLFHCRLVALRSCYAQAKVRQVACENGYPIPPLNY